jgi:hypothetical protein
LIAIWLMIVSANAECVGEKLATVDLSREVRVTTDAFLSEEPSAFTAGLERLPTVVNCLGTLADPADVAALYRLLGLGALRSEQTEAAQDAFLAAIVLQPTSWLTDDIAPANGPIANLYTEASSRPFPARVDVASQGYTVFVDGDARQDRPQGVPSLVQYMNDDGVMVWSGLVYNSGDVPKLLSTQTVLAAPAPVPIDVATTNLGSTKIAGSINPNKPLLASAGGSTALGGLLVAIAMSQRSTFDDELAGCIAAVGCDTTMEDFEAERSRINTLGILGQSALGIGVSLGITSFVVGF